MHIYRIGPVLNWFHIVAALIEPDLAAITAPQGLLSEQVVINLHNGDVPLVALHVEGMDLFGKINALILADGG